ncbi:hypothetical protein E2C01_065873 [Portunus trituberculatus]|uniref:Uncharacterized protein n=1 Tax=Portunus trituberculatus TaxID=210409 RepID=A0A5B7HFQ9_PORTR|nr:hypothetical protein [Portunus trituberculatus]
MAPSIPVHTSRPESNPFSSNLCELLRTMYPARRLRSMCNSPPWSHAGHPASLPHYGASSELMDQSSGRTETTKHTPHTGKVKPQSLELHPTPIYC